MGCCCTRRSSVSARDRDERPLHLPERRSPGVTCSLQQTGMPRNLDDRVEITFPVLGPNLQSRIHAMLETPLADTIEARSILGDASSSWVAYSGPEALRSQQRLYEAVVVSRDGAERQALLDVVTGRRLPKEGRVYVGRVPITQGIRARCGESPGARSARSSACGSGDSGALGVMIPPPARVAAPQNAPAIIAVASATPGSTRGPGRRQSARRDRCSRATR
jgi:hypothetical protein